MLKYCGAEIMGNYQAMFDLIYKSITLLLSPVVTSLYPLLTLAYEKGNICEIRSFLKRIILLELITFGFTSMVYWLGASDFLLYILKIPNEWVYKWIGFMIISGAFIWQLAILVQKKYELKMKSFFLLAMIFISLSFQIFFYIVKPNISNMLIYPIGFLLASFTYLLLISSTEIVSYIKNRKFFTGR
jgi:hypothetical protein